MTRARMTFLALLALLVLAAPASAQKDQRLEQAIEEAGVLFPPVEQLETPVGVLAFDEVRLLAARFDQPVRLTLRLERDVERGTISVGIPARWRSVPESGLRASTPPRQRGRAVGARVGGARDAVVMELDGARAGTELTAEIRDTGIAPGTYRLPVRYSVGSGAARSIGHLEIRFYAPVREAAEEEGRSPWHDLRAPIQVTPASGQQSEAFITTVPGNPDRILVGGNGGTSGYSAWLSNSGGAAWGELVVPTSADEKGSPTPINLTTCCDPMSAADAAGNIWYGGLDFTPASRIHVSRIAAGTTTFVNTVALPQRTGNSATQDKPMMTIDNKSSSPTFGRLYVVWDEPSAGGVNVVVSSCDTRPTGTLNATLCDNADNWSDPVSINKGQPSGYIYADVAVGPDGKVYVVWWDYTNVNAIVGATCTPTTPTACATVAGWTSASVIAPLDATGGAEVPFACPIMAQPGGRASTGSNVEVDISNTATAGRVWVAWSDLRTGSGTTRCADGLPPAPTHLSFDSLVKSAVNALPTSSTPPIRLLTDGEGGGQANSDDWFPWITIDQSTGVAYADFYSTRDDTSGLRRTTHFYVRGVLETGDLGALTRASTTVSNYSTNPCCGFGNDQGDYVGLDATGGFVFPVWSQKPTGGNSEIFMDRIAAPAPNRAPSAGISGPSSATVGQPVQFTATAADSDGTVGSFEWDLDGNGSRETATSTPSAQTTFGAPGTFRVTVRGIDNRGAASSDAGMDVAVSPAPTPTPTPTVPEPFVGLVKNRATIKVPKTGRFSVKLRGCAGCKGAMTLKTATKVARKRGAKKKIVRFARASFTFSATGTKTVKVKLSKANRALLRRLRKIGMAASLSATNSAGKTARATGVIFLKRK